MGASAEMAQILGQEKRKVETLSISDCLTFSPDPLLREEHCSKEGLGDGALLGVVQV